MRRLLGGRRDDGAPPHAVLAASPADTAVADLVANLGVRAGAQAAAFLLGVGDDLVPVAVWPLAAARFEALASTVGLPAAADAVRAILGERALVAPVLDGRRRRGVLAVTLPPGGTAEPAHEALLRETAACVAVALRGERLRAEVGARTADARRLAADLRASREHVELVRDAERRRLVAAIVAVTTSQLAGVRDTVRELSDTYARTPPAAPAALDQVRTRLDDLIDTFRTVVRGVHPTVLRERGPLAALEELVVDLPRPVRFDGDLARRAGWEVESGFYHGVAAALHVLTASGRTHPLRVALAYDGDLLTAVVHDRPAPGAWAARVRDALADDADRIAALGGALVATVGPDGVTVAVTMPDRFAPIELPAPPATVPDDEPSLLARLRALAAEGGRTDPPRAAEWAAIADRLDEPPRVAVTGSGAAAVVDALVGGEIATTLGARVPTWLTAGPAPHVTTWPRGGGRPDRAPLAVARLPRTPGDAALVERLAVQWPSASLRGVTLVHGLDGPRLDGPRLDGGAVVTGRGADSGAAAAAAVASVLTATVDAVVHVLPRRPAAADLALPRALRGTVPLVGVVRSTHDEERAAAVCDAVVRLDPRLALAGATLRDAEFRALLRLAAGRADDERDDRDQAVLLERFRLTGIAVAVEALRDGVVDGAAELAAHLAAHSGLPALRAAVDEHVARDGDLVVARWALRAMVALSRRGAPAALAREVERVAVTARGPAELDVLDAVRAGTLALPDPVAAARLLGGHGRAPRTRLGLPADAADADVARAAAAAADTWRAHAQTRAAGARTHDACLVVADAAAAIARAVG